MLHGCGHNLWASSYVPLPRCHMSIPARLPACFACLLGSVGLYSSPRAIPGPRFVSLKFYIQTIHTFFAVVSITLSGAVQY